MSRAARHLVEGMATFIVGLALWLFTGDIDTPVITLTKLGVVLMAIGGVQAAIGLYGSARPTAR